MTIAEQVYMEKKKWGMRELGMTDKAIRVSSIIHNKAEFCKLRCEMCEKHKDFEGVLIYRFKDGSNIFERKYKEVKNVKEIC